MSSIQSVGSTSRWPAPAIGRLLMLSVMALLAPGWVPAEGQRQTEERPNILFAIADDWSYGHAGAYGCRWIDTPGFDRVAREGLLFTRAYTPNAKCAPSRACIVTGRNSWQLKDACNHVCFFPPEFRSFSEALAEHGYFVGCTGKGWGPGIARDVSGNPRQMTGQPFNQRKARPPARAISDNDYASNFSDFLAQAPEGKPWCFWYGALEPHRGYEYGAGAAKGGKKLTDIEYVPSFWPDNDTVRNDMLDYGFEVTHFDRHLVRMLQQLEDAGQLDNTLVVVTSDHGLPFPRCKGQAYDYSNHVPLAIMWVGHIVEPHRTVDGYVSFVDLAPTFIEAAGLSWDQSGMQPSPGRSLSDVFEHDVQHSRDHVLIGKERHDIGRPNDGGYPIRGIVKDDMLYIRNFQSDRWPAGNPETGYLNCDGSPTKSIILNGRRDGSAPTYWTLCFGKRPTEELYNVTKDLDCVNNLASEQAFADLKQQLKQQLLAELAEQKDPRIAGDDDYFDNLRYANDGNRDFYRRYTTGEKVSAGWVNASDFEASPIRP